MEFLIIFPALICGFAKLLLICWCDLLVLVAAAEPEAARPKKESRILRQAKRELAEERAWLAAASPAVEEPSKQTKRAQRTLGKGVELAAANSAPEALTKQAKRAKRAQRGVEEELATLLPKLRPGDAEAPPAGEGEPGNTKKKKKKRKTKTVEQ